MEPVLLVQNVGGEERLTSQSGTKPIERQRQDGEDPGDRGSRIPARQMGGNRKYYEHVLDNQPDDERKQAETPKDQIDREPDASGKREGNYGRVATGICGCP